MRTALGVISSLALAYAGIVALLYVFQSRLVYFPQVGRDIAQTPRALGLAHEDVILTTEDGERLQAWWLPPSAGRTRGTAVLFPGNAGNRSHRIEYMQMFDRLGYSMLLLDYRGYGGSTGTPSEAGTYRDATAAWRWLVEHQGVPARRIVVAGESLGGAVACWLAARHQPGALVLASTFTSVPDLGASIYPLLPVRWISRFRYDNLECLRQVKSPVLVAHSPHDEIVPYRHGEALFEAATASKSMLQLSGSHNSGFIHARAEWVEALRVFLDGNLDPARSPG